MLQAPQQARAIATRARLVEAASALLVEEGLRGTTTAAVAARAEVSQGALFKHFPTKLDLLAACVEAVLASLVDAFRAALPKRTPADLDARLRVGVAALWKVFRLPAMQGLFEVYLAARTDPELGRALEPLLAAHNANIQREARALLPELASHPGLASGVDAVVYAMQGVALGVFSNDERRDREHLAFFERLAVHELAAAAPQVTQAAQSKAGSRARRRG
ncbi:TetR family transcriptional regulator [Sandaracinus amylolyticus]|uniref:Transcriptional regulator, TetR family protein n=1 Tax=Sandaracinus amylolyticus TaxID=927083 RepID=A0A0F6W008_9BACT|nr:TetR family transcriptional regulator [Sandaracinus amylolyticus]AKF03771.1 Transcriptional regulator, TetR family protein [Sandaracinus amylolyticus]